MRTTLLTTSVMAPVVAFVLAACGAGPEAATTSGSPPPTPDAEAFLEFEVGHPDSAFDPSQWHTLAYFQAEGCPSCVGARAAVDALTTRLEGKVVEFELLSTSAEDARTRMRAYGLERHGMVVVDGDDNVIWRQEGHDQTLERTVASIETALTR